MAGAESQLSPQGEAAVRSLGSGSPLPEAERSFFEPRLGADLGPVRVHTGPRAEAAAESISARAFALGSDIAFGAGEFRPGSAEGRRLIAHELAHTVQQGAVQQGAVERVAGPQETTNRTGDAQQTPASSALGDASRTSLGPRLQRQDEAKKKAAASSPAADAAAIIKAGGHSKHGGKWVSASLIAGIIRAEDKASDITRKIAEELGLGSSRGPGQLTKVAIKDADGKFPKEAAKFAKFAKKHGAMPAKWKEKAVHAKWSRFYIAAVLALKVDEAARIFQVKGKDEILNLGIGMYQGGFSTLKAVRRAIAAKKKIAKTKVTWKMIEDYAKTHSTESTFLGGVQTTKIVHIVRYVRNARGLPPLGIVSFDMPPL
ncbi:MAG: DUF4157 domain-containing protein [Acidobacteriota bacterium]